MPPSTYALIFLAGYFLIFCSSIIGCWMLRSRLKRRRPPLLEKLLRLPGEALLQEAEKIESRLFGQLLIAAMVPLIPFIVLAIVGPTVSLWLLLPPVALALFGIYFSVCKLWGFLEYRSDTRLGLLGERAVGEQLQALLSHGYQVFHDLPGEVGPNGWDIDHVVIGPAGVFALETKARRSGSKVLPGRIEYEIVFDGEKLLYPWGEDIHGLEQAQRQATLLGNWLSHAVGERIAVKPVLVFPGWNVTRRGTGSVLVLSHKELPLAFPADSPQQLNEQTIQRIAFHLEQRCRDVEF